MSSSTVLDHNAIPNPADESDLPIEIYFGSPALDFGTATLPRILPRFWIYLTWNGEQLTDWEYAVLVQVLTLRDSQDYELRAANLPVRSKLSSIERVKAKLRRMGLVFTQRLYYPPVAGETPKMFAQRWDMRPLFYNLELIARLWSARQQQQVANWNATGRNGRKPIFNFDPGFTHKIQLPTDVCLDILRGVFYPVPEHWLAVAQAQMAELPTAHIMRGRAPTTREMRGTPTAHDMRGTAPTAHEMRGYLLEDEEEEEGQPPQPGARVMCYFADRRGIPDYEPTAKERAALQKLLAEGFTDEQIIAGIDEAFSRPSKPRYFTHCAAIARDLAHRQQENQPPEPRTQPETRGQEALPAVESSPAEASQANNATSHPNTPSEPALVIDAHLGRAVEVYRSTDREITADLLARFRLMAAKCDAAAKAHQSTGGDWLADALASALGVARPNSLLNYADAVLDDWIRNGRAERSRPVEKPKQARPKKGAESGVSRALQDYLDQHGELFDGNPD